MRDRRIVLGFLTVCLLVGAVFWAGVWYAFAQKTEARRMRVAETMGVDVVARRESRLQAPTPAAAKYEALFLQHDSMEAEVEAEPGFAISGVGMSAYGRGYRAPMDDCEAAALSRFWSRHGTYIAELEAAAREPDCRFDVDWRDGLDASTRHGWSLYQASLFLSSHMLHVGAQNDVVAVVRDMEIAAAMMDAWRADRCQISFRKGASHTARIIDALAIALHHMTPTDEDLAAMQMSIATLYAGGDYDDAVIGEIELTLISLEDPLWIVTPWCGNVSAYDRAVGPVRTGYERRMLLGELPFLLPARQMAPDERLVAAETARRWRRHTLMRYTHTTYTLTHLAEKDAVHAVNVNVAITALAAERFRLAFGEWPPDIASLAPFSIPGSSCDWFAAGDLKLTRDGDTICVYSVGPDRIDDGGVQRSPREQQSTYDIVFAIRRPIVTPGR